MSALIPLMFTGICLYLAIGMVIAAYSGTHFWFFTLQWPWAVAAQIVKSITGKYPKWTPPL